MLTFFHRLRMVLALLPWLCGAAALAQAQPSVQSPVALPANAPASAAAGPDAPVATVPLSRGARRIYEITRDKLVQIRTLLRNTNTQSTVGSGFFVSEKGLIVTNFHVASQLALEPERYRGVYVAVDGQEADVELLAFDVRRDLAVLRVKDSGAARPVLEFRPPSDPMAQGERIYSLGNPLDIGFAVTEGTYNGEVKRSFYPRIFFGGTLNPGMSGGPAVDDAGRVIGINVAKRLDGEQVSFLIPAEFAKDLIKRAANAQPITKAAYGEVARQLKEHQELLAQRFLATPFRVQQQGHYRVPVPDEQLARCWGAGRDPNRRAFTLERTDCRVDSDVVAGDYNTGYVRLRYEAYDAPDYSAARFASMYSQSFRNEPFAYRGTGRQTAAECVERYVDRGGLPMRAVVCMTAYRRFPGLYDVSVLVATLNKSKQGVQGRMDAEGVSFDNGLKLVEHYLDAFRWEPAP
jgi:serine protease Do